MPSTEKLSIADLACLANSPHQHGEIGDWPWGLAGCVALWRGARGERGQGSVGLEEGVRGAGVVGGFRAAPGMHLRGFTIGQPWASLTPGDYMVLPNLTYHQQGYIP